MQIYLGNGVWNNEAKLKPNDDLTDNDIFKKALKYGMSVMISGYIKINDIDFDFDRQLLIEVEAFETVTEVKKKVKEIWTTKSSNFPLQDPRISKRSKFFSTFSKLSSSFMSSCTSLLINRGRGKYVLNQSNTQSSTSFFEIVI